MATAELALIPTPGAGHLAPMVELGKTLTSRNSHISVTIFIMEYSMQSKVNSYTQTLLSNQPPPHMRFVHLTLHEASSEFLWLMKIPEVNKPRIKEFYLAKPIQRLKAFVVDMFCSSFIDLTSEFGLPSYMFFTSNAGPLSLMLHKSYNGKRSFQFVT